MDTRFATWWLIRALAPVVIVPLMLIAAFVVPAREHARSQVTFEAAAAYPAIASLAPGENLSTLVDRYCPPDAGIDPRVWIAKVCELNGIADPDCVQPGRYLVPDLRPAPPPAGQ